MPSSDSRDSTPTPSSWHDLDTRESLGPTSPGLGSWDEAGDGFATEDQAAARPEEPGNNLDPGSGEADAGDGDTGDGGELPARRGFGIAGKLSFATMFPVLLLAAAATYLAFEAVRSSMLEGSRATARATARGLAASATDLLVAGDDATLQLRVSDAVADPHVAYVLILGAGGEPRAHSFVPSVPGSLLSNQPEGAGGRRITFEDPETGREISVLEVTENISAGEQ
ncbi:MAG: hypothetical protein MI919_28140, partial [Holophagales bacterium]|nr:hypothetical protein [Holophagales bacterium]